MKRREPVRAEIEAATAEWIVKHGPVPRSTEVKISILGPIQEKREHQRLKRLAKLGYTTPMQIHMEADSEASGRAGVQDE